MLPRQKDIEVALLQALVEIGGQSKPLDIYPLVTKRFPQLNDQDLAESLPSGPNRWTNRVQWARQALVHGGDMDSPGHGIWRITKKGRERAAAGVGPAAAGAVPSPSFAALYDDYVRSFRAQLLDRLHALTSREFEYFGRRLLLAYGFVDVTVTRVAKDGGIDGYGKLRLGLAEMSVAFQCKKWQGSVGRPEVDKFRGAIQGEFEQGVFFTTSDFTPDARSASLKKGAAPIILLNGESIVGLMIEKGLGVDRVPLYALYERPADFSELDDDQG